MNDPNPIATAVREAVRERRLGPDAHCWRCGYENPAGLSAATGRVRTLLEDHHVFGRNHNPWVVVCVCQNCHAEITELYRCAGVPMGRQDTPQLSAKCALEARGVFLGVLAESIFQQDSVAPWKGAPCED